MSSSSLFLLTAIAFNVLTSTFFKWSALKEVEGGQSTILFAVGLVFGFANAYCYTQSLKTITLNVAYPIFSVGSVIVLNLIAYFFFREQFSVTKFFGIVFLIGGLYLISYRTV